MTFDHVELFVPDRRAAAAWYQRVLGLEIMPGYESWADDPRGPLMVSGDGGHTKIALFEGPSQGDTEIAGYRLAAFRADAAQFTAFLDRLPELNLIDHRGQTVRPDSAVDHDLAWSIYFCDPYGNRLELTTYEHDAIRRALSRK